MKTLARICSVVPLIVLLAGCANQGGQNAHLWNPWTWFSHSAAAAVDGADKKEAAAGAKVGTANSAAIHAAHVEFFKSSIVQLSLPKSRATDLDVRFLGNGLGLLDQVDGLTAAEVLDARKLAVDLLSDEVAKREAAEQKQGQAESDLGKVSRELTAAQQDLSGARKERDAKEVALRAAFDRENALANEMRNQIFIKWAAIVAVILVTCICLYLRMALGSVGAGLHVLPKLIGADASAKVVQALDSGTDWLHQTIIKAGREKAQKLELRAQNLLGIAPAPSGPSTPP